MDPYGTIGTIAPARTCPAVVDGIGTGGWTTGYTAAVDDAAGLMLID
jgi:hypothetical protein